MILTSFSPENISNLANAPIVQSTVVCCSVLRTDICKPAGCATDVHTLSSSLEGKWSKWALNLVSKSDLQYRISMQKVLRAVQIVVYHRLMIHLVLEGQGPQNGSVSTLSAHTACLCSLDSVLFILISKDIS